MDDLRQRVARGEYSVDSSRVAGSLVQKMRLIRIARRSIAGQPESERRGAAESA